MKRNRFFTAIGLITAVWFSACTNDEQMNPNVLPEGKYPLEIASVMMSVESSSEPWGANAPQTRVTESNTDGKSSVWEWNGTEQIGVQIGDGKTGTYVLNEDKTVTAENACYWASTATGQTVKAWFPNTDEPISLADQSKGLAYVLQATETADFDKTVTLGFTHQLAKVRVVLDGTQAAQAETVEVRGYTSCTHTAGAVSTEGAEQGWLKMKRTTYADGTECWEANVVPGNITLNNFIRINGIAATINNDFPTTLDAAKMYTINLTVGDNQIFGGETITKPGKYIVKGTVTESITLDSEDITLILDGASINTYGTAINIVSGNPTVKIQGTENHAKSTTSTAIHVGSGCTLTIEGVNGAADKLKAEGGKNEGTSFGPGNAGAGIGSSNGGNIVISNVTIEATGETFHHFTGPSSGGGAAIGSSGPGVATSR